MYVLQCKGRLEMLWTVAWTDNGLECEPPVRLEFQELIDFEISVGPPGYKFEPRLDDAETVYWMAFEIFDRVDIVLGEVPQPPPLPDGDTD